MPVLPNYLALGQGSECVGPAVIEAFRQHFHEAINVGGTEPGFMTRWNNFRESLLSAAWMSAEDSDDDRFRHESINNMGAQLDSLYNLILGMGQLAFAWQLIPTPADLEDPETVSATPSSKTKTKEARRFTHVLSNIIAKNFRVEGPHGVPMEARRNVPDEDGMIAEMIEAMADRSEILDFADTKPFKDHWQNMREPNFRRLAKTLIYHINELHQGIDYVEGFCYTDRYRNLITLLKGCKGTIYFMSRPSTYEDVILNPHMMRLRFADNQKNNSKKKADNKELTSRRNSEYISLHGCPPPTKPRAGKGRKRAASSMIDNENEEASPSPVKPAAKRQRAAPRNYRATSRVAFDAGEGSSAQQTVDTLIDTTFLDIPDPDSNEFYQLQQQFLHTPDEQQQKPHYPSLEQNQQYYNPAQHQQTPPPQLPQQPTPRKSASKRQRKNSPKEDDTQAVALRSNVDLGSPFLDQSNDIENQIATTLADAVRSGTYTAGPSQMLDFESSTSNEPSEASRQIYQQAAFYRAQDGLYPDISVSPTNKVVPVHDQIAQFQFIGQMSPASHSQQFRQEVGQGLGGQPQSRQQSHDPQYMSVEMSNDTLYWGEETVTPDFSGFTDEGQAGLGGERQQGTIDPEIFDQGNEVIGTNYFGINTNAPGFGDLDLGSSINSGYFSYLPSTNTGGQGTQTALGGQFKMKEMEDMLAIDP